MRVLLLRRLRPLTERRNTMLITKTCDTNVLCEMIKEKGRTGIIQTNVGPVTVTDEEAMIAVKSLVISELQILADDVAAQFELVKSA